MIKQIKNIMFIYLTYNGKLIGKHTGSGLLRPIIDKFLYNQEFQNNIHIG